MDNKKLYLYKNYDYDCNDQCILKLTKEEHDIIAWFIDTVNINADLNIGYIVERERKEV